MARSLRRRQDQRLTGFLSEVKIPQQAAKLRCCFSHVGRGSGRPSVFGSRRRSTRKMSSMNFCVDVEIESV